MHPQPLLRIASHIRLDRRRKQSRVRQNILLRVPRPHQLQPLPKPQYILRLRRPPTPGTPATPRHPSSTPPAPAPSRYRPPRRSTAQTHPAVASIIRVHQDPHRLPPVHRRQQPPREVVFMDHPYSPCSERIAFTNASTPRIVQPPDHQRHRIPHQRVIEARQFPRPQMPRQYQHTVALIPRRKIVLQPVIPDEPRGLRRAVPTHLAELSRSAIPSDRYSPRRICRRSPSLFSGYAISRFRIPTRRSLPSTAQANAPIPAPAPRAIPRGSAPTAPTIARSDQSSSRCRKETFSCAPFCIAFRTEPQCTFAHKAKGAAEAAPSTQHHSNLVVVLRHHEVASHRVNEVLRVLGRTDSATQHLLKWRIHTILRPRVVRIL